MKYIDADKLLSEINARIERCEKDENMRNNTILSLQSLIDEGINDEFIKGVKDEITWLKSLRSQPHWKPSEEQMEALENSTALTEEQGEALYSLVQDLKKL